MLKGDVQMFATPRLYLSSRPSDLWQNLVGLQLSELRAHLSYVVSIMLGKRCHVWEFLWEGKTKPDTSSVLGIRILSQLRRFGHLPQECPWQRKRYSPYSYHYDFNAQIKASVQLRILLICEWKIQGHQTM